MQVCHIFACIFSTNYNNGALWSIVYQSYLYWTGVETWGLQASPLNCSASTRGEATPSTSLAHSEWRYWIDRNMSTSNISTGSQCVHQQRSSLAQVVSLRPYITVTHGLLLPGEPDEVIARAAPQLRRLPLICLFVISLLLSYFYPIRSEMVGKMVNGTGLSDDRRVSNRFSPQIKVSQKFEIKAKS